MGALFSGLKGGGSEGLPDVVIPFDDIKPQNKEESLYKEILGHKKTMADTIELIKSYKGCSEEIREAISKPSDESNIKVWKALQPSIKNSVKMYKFSAVLGEFSLKLVDFICAGNDATQALEQNPGLTKLFVDILSFVVDFDEIKTHNSDLQNDFSFYRRSINKFKMLEKDNKALDSIISDEEANYMSLFFAHHTPMFKALSHALTEYLKKNPENSSQLINYISLLTGSCYHSITKGRVSDSKTKDDLLRAMVACTVLYDTLEPEGVFTKTSPIDLKLIIKAITTSSDELTEPLMNGLRFNLVHLNDKTTPKQVKVLLGAN